ncbi:hypothetical protein CHLRE_08g358569v5 [Chlamydomonas reinhardtii]|uniref:Nucleotide-diphospho-sugar transferase domain-containing protein n=1 Tax=Chlamydomonas reinhardtii TaxID=3055 RepID=A0A2K3DG94_CHLRE|nr:uncharacterized protein CHLRE_08g358569v5 [Chlamydomonas reinhardtii]PNW79560.1 hypothetical protein CHLRE_08g358569v5 [Chlamydomonas reinhardtii]
MSGYTSTFTLVLVCLAAWAHWSVQAKAHDMHLHQHYLRLKVCDRRGGGAYCSWGATRGYVGPLDSAANIKEALEATQYKKELILFSEDRMPEATQSLARFRNAGYSHIIGILPELAECHRLAHIFAPWTHEHGPLQCGTYATRDPSGKPYPVGFPFLARGIGMTVWWRKWYTAARAVALGYNVLALDSDNLVLGDLYWRVKAPDSPLSEINLFTQAECGDCVNSGFVYIQNAAPNGPIAWMLYDMVLKVVRWAEDPSGIFDLSPKAKAANWIWSDDQESMSDVLYSAITGKPRFFILAHNLNMHKDEEAYKKLGVANGDELMKNIKPPKDKWTFKKYDLAGTPLAEVACDHLPDLERCRREVAAATTHLMTAELQMPHCGGEWPGSLGGYPFNKTLGPIALAYRQSFKDLGVPLPPDPEDPATEAAARATRKEKYGLVHVRPGMEGGVYPAGWLEGTWFRTGRHGLWHTHLLQHEFQSFAHIHASLFPGDFQKQLVMQAAGIYDWRVGARLAGGANRPYYLYDDSERTPQPELRRVVAYLDGVVGPWLSKKEVIAAANGLAQVAVALGAAAAWPAVDCSSDWVQLRPGMTGYSALLRAAANTTTAAGSAASGSAPAPAGSAAPVMEHSIPWSYLDTSFQAVPFGPSLRALKCMWPGFTWRDCLTSRRPHRPPVGRGLTPVEFEHLVQLSERQLAAEHAHWWDQRQRLRQVQPWLPSFGPVLRLAKDGPAATPLSAAPGAAPPPAPGAGALLHAVRYDELLELNVEALLQGGGAGGGVGGAGGPEPSVPVLWVDRLVGGVEGLRGEAAALYGNWTKECRGLRYYDIPERDRTNW